MNLNKLVFLECEKRETVFFVCSFWNLVIILVQHSININNGFFFVIMDLILSVLHILLGVTQKSVSYTHLDVYKRQVYDQASDKCFYVLQILCAFTVSNIWL